MKQSAKDIERLWAMSELEQRIELRPEAATMRELADRYEEMGWLDEARKMRDRAVKAPALPKGDTAPPMVPAPAPRSTPDVPDHSPDTLSGRFTPAALVEILHVLHLTGKTGELVAETLGGTVATVAIVKGRLVAAHATGGELGEAALHLATRIRGGRYQFTPRASLNPPANLPEDSAALIAALTAEVSAR